MNTPAAWCGGGTGRGSTGRCSTIVSTQLQSALAVLARQKAISTILSYSLRGAAYPNRQGQWRIRTCLYLVTETQVLEAVEVAEKLWAQALEARKTANALSDRAEEEAEAAAENAKEIDALFQEQRENKQSITMQQLAQADTAARTNLDAGNLVNKALRAAEEADRLERLAEDALRQSEESLEQHLRDFPESSLAQ
jgi:hypothetical protein